MVNIVPLRPVTRNQVPLEENGHDESHVLPPDEIASRVMSFRLVYEEHCEGREADVVVVLVALVVTVPSFRRSS